MDSSDISRLYFQHRAYMDATKKEKEISNSRMSPKMFPISPTLG